MKRLLSRGSGPLAGLPVCLLLLGAAASGAKMPGAPQPVSAHAARYERVMAAFETGDFSAYYCEEGSYPQRGDLERCWQIGEENEGRTGVFPSGNAFARADLDRDGRDELIWSETAEAGGGRGVHRIIGIFRYERGWMKKVVWDTVYSSHYYFLCPNGNIAERGYYFGTYRSETFCRIEFDQD